MYSKLIKTIATGLATVGFVNANFNADGHNNIVMYWGQASAGSQKSLGDYCDQEAGDIYVISFISSFGQGTPKLTVSGCNGDTCPEIGSDIKKCQSKGKKVLVALGGAAGDYGFQSDSEAETFADTLWDLYGGGNGQNRPFGDAQVDGFDLDIENNNQVGYPAMVKKLRQHFDGADKDYYISAAPQCVYPDQNVGDALTQSEIDFAFIQFYNNPCAIGKSGFNWDTWSDFAKNKSPNKNIKLFLGLPGSQSAAGSGYVDPDQVKEAVNKIGDDPSFAGIMMWDASQAYQNVIGGSSFAVQMKDIVGGSGNPSDNGGNTSKIGLPSIVTGGSGSSTAAASGASSAATTSPAASGSAPASSSAAASGSAPATSAVGAASSGNINENAQASSSAAPVTSPAQGSQETSGTVQVTDYASQTSVNQVTTTMSPPATSMVASASSAAPSSQPTGSTTGQQVDPNTVPQECKGKTGSELSDCLNGSFSNGTNTGGSSGESCETEGQLACKDGKFAVCNYKKWVVFDCPEGTTCSATSQGQDAFVGCNFEKNKRADTSPVAHGKWAMGKIHVPMHHKDIGGHNTATIKL